MKKIHILFLFVLALTFVGMPSQSSAYSSTEQTAVRINEDTILFTITYRFSWLNHAVSMPIGTKRTAVHGASSPYVGYELFTEEGELFGEGKSSALILSDAEIVGTEYSLPTNKAGHFTLVALVDVKDVGVLDTKIIQMRITSIPFTLTRSGESERVMLDRTQLVTHQTPFVSL